MTTTLPLAAPVGTTAVMLLVVQAETAAGFPLKVTVPVVPVKFFPVMVTEAPARRW